MKTKTHFIVKGWIPILILLLFLASCGKKEEPQTQTQQQPQQQIQQQQQQQNQQQIQQQKQADSLQLAEKQKQEEQKKKEEEKKQAEEKKLEQKKLSGETPDIDFAPIFQQKCVKCHGKDGKGKAEGTPDFTSASFKKKSDERLFKSITNGIKATNPDNESMPAWKGKLTDDQIRAAIKYVKGL